MVTPERPRFAVFVTPIHFDNQACAADTVAQVLVLEPKAVRRLLKDIARADRLCRQYSPSAKLVVDHTFNLYELTPNLVQGSGRIEAGSVALPIDGPGFGLLEVGRAVRGRLHASRSGVYWTVPPKGFDRGFRTGFVSWEDLIEWRLLMANRRGVSSVFRRLVEGAPDRALAILERGTCFDRRFATDKPYKVTLPQAAVEPLLSHESAGVREAAIKYLGSSPALVAE